MIRTAVRLALFILALWLCAPNTAWANGKRGRYVRDRDATEARLHDLAGAAMARETPPTPPTHGSRWTAASTTISGVWCSPV